MSAPEKRDADLDAAILAGQVAVRDMAFDWYCPRDPGRPRYECRECVAEVAVRAIYARLVERARWERAPVSAPEPQVRDEAEVRRDERQRIWTEIAERRHKALRISRHETPDRAWDCIPMSALCDLLMERAQ